MGRRLVAQRPEWRYRDRDAIHYSDAGSVHQYGFGETLDPSGLQPSVGSVADAYDNVSGRDHDGALQQRVHPGRFAVSPGPCCTLGDVKYCTADYVAWYNQWRLMHALDESDPPMLGRSTIPNT